MATRKLLGPVVKNRGENFLLVVTLGDVIPAGETIDLPSCSAESQTRTSSPTDSSADVLDGAPATVTLDGTEALAVRLKVNPPSADGEHVVEIRGVTMEGSIFEAQVLVKVMERREPILYVTKLTRETFPIGIDFSPMLDDGEMVTSAAVTSVNKFSGASTTVDLLAQSPQITGALVADILNEDTDDSTDDTDHFVLVEATTDAGNVFQETIEVHGEASI